MSTDATSRATVSRTWALSEAALTAGRAPSIHDTQPWRWRLAGDELTLRVGRSGTGEIAGAQSRLAVLSCGVALHHAMVSLAADGWHTLLTRMPDPAYPDRLARLRIGDRIPVSLVARRNRQTIALGHTGHRLRAGALVDADTLDIIGAVAASAGVGLRLLRSEETDDLGTVTDGSAAYAILHGSGDREVDWLRAGEALSAAWLRATELGLWVLPLSAAIEVDVTRERIRQRLFSGSGYPYLVLRFSTVDVAAPRTPRLPADQLIERD